MQRDGRFYLACAAMLLALAGCTHGTSVAVRFEDSYAMAEPDLDLVPGERKFREATPVRIYLLLGQGGLWTSSGMLALQTELGGYGLVSVPQLE